MIDVYTIYNCRLKVNAAPQSAGNYCMSFQYHMYTAFGDHMGDLSVIARSGMQGQEITYFNVAGNQGNQWLKADIIIPMNSSTQVCLLCGHFVLNIFKWFC